MMENLKVKVNSEAESKEAQELFFELGGSWASCGKTYNDMIQMGDYIFFTDCNMLNYGLGLGREEITIQKLRELVVLKQDSMKETEYLMQGKNGERLMESIGQLNSGKIVSAFVVDGEEKHSHYRKSVKHLDFIDPYRIAQLYSLHPCADHIAKKALCTGKRGHKDLMRDIQDIIDTAERWKQMIQEDQNAI